jgi:serine/threonine protein kinase
VAELKKLLSGLIKGERSFDQVRAAFQQFLSRSPGKAPLVAKLLRAARDAGLSQPTYVALSGDLGLHVDTSIDPEATVLAFDEEDDLRRGWTAGRNPAEPEDHGRPAVQNRGLAVRIDAGPASVETANARGMVPDEATQMDAVLGHDPLIVGPVSDTAEELDESGNDPFFTPPVKSHADKEDATDGDGDATDKTIALGAGVDFDLFSEEALASAEQTADPNTGASWPTVREHRHPGVSRAFRKGDQLRNRFELISELGQGGMGAVWKGKDLLKEEARDRNPFVAIKLLQGDFKEYPEAFIALQRETAKQQRLAHPNIATVYDFDRDDSSNSVYMTMEVLEGQPLDAFIRKLPADGLPVQEAMPLIEQLCDGLAHAHSHGLVHADLKPGNCFYTKDGTIKLLDFGIARASKTKADAEGETTLFDPGEFGALTPAYATVDMFEGVDPDPRDDIYALSIMTYQLLTGKHPYNKKAAPKARELGLKPAPIAKLNKRQNKALMRGLAFEREDRTPTVEDFFESIRPRKSRLALFAAAGLAAMLIIGFAVRGPTLDLIAKSQREQIISTISQRGIENVRGGLDQAKALDDPDQLDLILNDRRTKEAIVALIADGGEVRVKEWLALIAPFDLQWQREIKEVELVKSAVMNAFDFEIDEAFDVERNRYDFPAASALIASLEQMYPESPQVLRREELLKREKSLALAALSDEYTRHLEQGRLLPEEGGRHIGEVIAAVGRIDPRHPLLEDRRLQFRYVELAQEAIEGGSYGRAGGLLRAGLSYTPGDPKLSDLSFRLRSELQRIANQRRAAEIELRLGPQLASLEALADFLRMREDLILLGHLSPSSRVLAGARAKLRPLFENLMHKSATQRRWAEGESALLDFSVLFEIPYLLTQRRFLSEIAAREGHTFAMTFQRRADVDERVRDISELLADPVFTTEWEMELTIRHKELIALLSPRNPIVEQAQRQTARIYLQRSRTALESGRFLEALAFVDRGRVYYPGLEHFDDFREAILVGQKSGERRREIEQRLARIEALKTDFRAAAQRNDVQDAGVRLDRIRAEELPPDDPFLLGEARLELALAYLRLARGRVEAEPPDYQRAFALAGKGLELAPELEALRFAAASYEREIKKIRREAELRSIFEGSGEIDVAAAKSRLQRFQLDFPQTYRGLRRELAQTRGNGMRELANSKDLRIPSLHQRMDEYRALFSERAPALHQSLAAIVEKRIRAARILSAQDLKTLSATLSDFRAFAPEAYASLSKDLISRLASRIRALEQSDKPAAASLLEASVEQFGEAPFSGLETAPGTNPIR